MESLLDRARNQALLDLADPSIAPSDETKKEYTGALFFADHPQKYAEIVHHLAEGIGLLRISRMLRVSVHTVIGVRDREPVAIQKERSRLSDLARIGARLSVEGIVEDLADPIRRYMMPARDKAIVAGILVEKSELLAGGATQRVEHIFDDPTEIDFNRIIDATCREAEATHLEAGTPGQKGSIAEGAAPAAAPGIPSYAGDPAKALPAHQELTAIAVDVTKRAVEPTVDRAEAPPDCKTLNRKAPETT